MSDQPSFLESPSIKSPCTLFALAAWLQDGVEGSLIDDVGPAAEEAQEFYDACAGAWREEKASGNSFNLNGEAFRLYFNLCMKARGAEYLNCSPVIAIMLAFPDVILRLITHDFVADTFKLSGEVGDFDGFH